MHLTGERDIARSAAQQPTGVHRVRRAARRREDLRDVPLTDRRARLERGSATPARHACAARRVLASDGQRRSMQAGERGGWEGLIVKDADSPYESGRRSRSWRKLKLVKQQEFVIGGWTEPRDTRSTSARCCSASTKARGAAPAGHIGSGFTPASWRGLRCCCARAQTRYVPFTPDARDTIAHWVEPSWSPR